MGNLAQLKAGSTGMVESWLQLSQLPAALFYLAAANSVFLPFAASVAARLGSKHRREKPKNTRPHSEAESGDDDGAGICYGAG